MEIRLFQAVDLPEIQQLFYDTVRKVNSRDYSQKQIEVWSSQAWDGQVWQKRLHNSLTYVAQERGQILGFTNLEENGHIDLFYCHYKHQGQGIGSQLLNHLEAIASALKIERLFTEASITARLFFERKGFIVLQAEQVERQGLIFRRFVMEKNLS
jgi:GNAT superfamily N-acetyltransferase